MMQVCTVAVENTAFTESGNPLSLSSAVSLSNHARPVAVTNRVAV